MQSERAATFLGFKTCAPFWAFTSKMFYGDSRAAEPSDSSGEGGRSFICYHFAARVGRKVFLEALVFMLPGLRARKGISVCGAFFEARGRRSSTQRKGWHRRWQLITSLRSSKAA